MPILTDRAPMPQDVAGLLSTLAATDRFRTLLRALEVTALAAQLRDADVTLFAPSDRAFEQLPAEERTRLFARPAELRAVLERHLVDGRYHARDLIPFTRLRTRAGTDLGIRVHDDSDTLVNGVPLLTPDLLGARGVAHELAELLP